MVGVAGLRRRLPLLCCAGILVSTANLVCFQLSRLVQSDQKSSSQQCEIESISHFNFVSTQMIGVWLLTFQFYIYIFFSVARGKVISNGL